MEKRYNVVYTCKIHPKAILSDVVGKVSSIFKISPEKAELFITSQKPRIIKRNIPLEIAKKYQDKLIQIGLQIDLKEINHKVSLQSIPENTIKSHKKKAEFEPSKLYSPKQIGWGTFLGGPLAATYFLKNNFDTLGKERYSKKTITIGLTMSIMLIAIIPFIPERFPGTTIALLYLIPVMLVVKSHQLTKKEILESSEYSFQSSWKVLGMISVWMAVYCIVAFLFIFVLEFAGRAHILDDADNPNTINKSGSETLRKNHCKPQYRSYMMDKENNGSFDTKSVDLYTYDDNGNILSKVNETDSNNDGIIDFSSSETLEYDINGNKILFLSKKDRNNDGTVDSTLTNVYTYDVYGNNSTISSEGDRDNNNSLDYRSLSLYTYINNADGKLISRIVKNDENVNGTVDSTSTYSLTYDINGNLILEIEEKDKNNDGEIDFKLITTNFYDVYKNIIQRVREIDRNVDDITDSKYTDLLQYNNIGRLVSTTYENDRDNDGTIDSKSTKYYSYDDKGNEIYCVEELDTNNNGTINFKTRTTFENYKCFNTIP